MNPVTLLCRAYWALVGTLLAATVTLDTENPGCVQRSATTRPDSLPLPCSSSEPLSDLAAPYLHRTVRPFVQLVLLCAARGKLSKGSQSEQGKQPVTQLICAIEVRKSPVAELWHARANCVL